MDPDGLASTPRFELCRRLGTAEDGEAYEAWDHERGHTVALKILQWRDGRALKRFQEQLPELCRLYHPNLARLYGLHQSAGEWYVTMELVDGVDFVRWVRAPEVVEAGTAAVEARLRAAGRQLALGLQALHEAGHLHGGLKPSNVLVDHDGRVVILDAGLFTATQQDYDTVEGISGISVYMAPEQGVGKLFEASDWYSAGVLFYEALTGRPPWSGSFVQVMLAKGRKVPAAPRTAVPDLSEELDALCRDLLKREPETRPGGTLTLARLGAGEGPSATPPVDVPEPLVGRLEQLEAIERAWVQARSEGTTLYVHGPSGAGKTVLVETFLKRLRDDEPEAVVLTGRSWADLTASFKAFHGVVDALVRHLTSLDDAEAATLLPLDAPALVRLFPAFKRVRPIADRPAHVLDIPDALELRRHAFTALKDLLARIAEERPTVVAIDNLQWGDLDSAALLADLMRPPDPPRLLLVLVYRGAAEDEANEVVRALRPGHAGSSVTELSGKDLEIPVLQGGDVPAPDDSETVRSRAVGLGDASRRLLEVLAVAGQPLEVGVARRAAGLEPGELAAFAALVDADLARMSGTGGDDAVAIRGDRTAAAVLAGRGEDHLAEVHLRLARSYEAAGRGDPETLARHFADAGETTRALEYTAAAAERAAKGLAFERAVGLYRRALAAADGDKTYHLRRKLAEVLVNAGRSAEAARVFLELAAAGGAEAVEMRRRAAEHFLVSGRVDEGLEALDEVMASVGWKLPRSLAKALPELLGRRLAQATRRFLHGGRDHVHVHASARISPDLLTRIDVCWSAIIGLGFVDTARGAAIQARHFGLALTAGEPYRMVRALALEAGFTATGGGRVRERTATLLRQASTLAERLQNPHADGLVAFTTGLAAYLEGRWRDARRELEQAERTLRDRCWETAWELDSAQFYSLRALQRLGELPELRWRLPVRLREARERGDLYAETCLRTRLAWLVHLTDDEPGEALGEIDEAIAAWSQEGFHLQHMWALMSRTEVALYRGAPAGWEGDGPWELLEKSWRRLEKSLYRRIQCTFVDTHHLHARAALQAAAARPPSRRSGLLAAAKRDAELIARQDMPWSNPIARKLEAAVAATQGDTQGALSLLRWAETGFDDADMPLYAAVVKRRRGELLGGDLGDELCREADRFLRDRAVQAPARFATMMAPGRWGGQGA